MGDEYLNTSCYPFHQLMVQSSGLINQNLERSWNDMIRRNPNLAFNYSRGNSYISNPSLTPPRIRVTPERVLYIVGFRSGSAETMMHYSHKSYFNMSGWELAFPSGIEMERLSSGRKFNTVMRKLEIQDEDRDNFRLAQFKFSPDATFDKSESHYSQGHHPFDTNNLIRLLNEWWLDHRDKMVTVFGYSLITSRRQVTPLARLSFPVYDMQLGVYQDKGIAAAAWCHLDSGMPPMSELERAGSFVDDTSVHPATLCISRTQFWDDWFMKIVASLPLHLVFRLGTPFSVGHELAKVVDAEPWWSSGRDRMIPPEYRWWARHCDPDYLEFDWEWDQKTGGGFDGAKVNNRLHLSYSQGQVFTIQGQQSVVTDGSYPVRHGPLGFEYYTWSFTCNWEMKFTLRAVDDGGLQIIPEVTVNTKTDWNRKRPFEWWKQYIDGMTEHVKRVLENLKKAIFNNVDEGLKNQQTMHLPGEGLFFLSHPTFNQRGDLLATLTWNGKLAAAAKDSAGLAILSDQDNWEPDLSAVAHLPARQQPYVLHDSVPTIFHATALEDLQSNLLEVDEREAEKQHRVDQEAIQAGEIAKANQEVTS